MPPVRRHRAFCLCAIDPWRQARHCLKRPQRWPQPAPCSNLNAALIKNSKSLENSKVSGPSDKLRNWLRNSLLFARHSPHSPSSQLGNNYETMELSNCLFSVHFLLDALLRSCWCWPAGCRLLCSVGAHASPLHCTQLTCALIKAGHVAAFSLTQVVNQLCNNNRLPRLTVALWEKWNSSSGVDKNQKTIRLWGFSTVLPLSL